MTPRSNILLWLIATAAVAALTSWVVTHRPSAPAAARRTGPGPDNKNASSLSLHDWMHRQLDLSPAQHSALAPLESAYESDRARIRQTIAQLGGELAVAMRDSAPDAGILALQQKLNAAQGELQQATLKHFIAMRQQLTPRQARDLALWTHDSLLLSPAE